ncbi:ceramidase [Spinellus fusiger]|nr:ceramidase [Spinellus fusiger]
MCLAMVIFGILGTYLHYNSMGWRFCNSYLLIVVVGVGSVLFHATLQYEHQMWDEVPMVWAACYLLWNLLYEQGHTKIIYGVFIALYCCMATYLTSQYKGSTQFYFFQSSFGAVMWSCFWLVWKLYKGAQNHQIIRLFYQGTKFLIAAISVWLFDANLCFVFDYIPNPQLHAWWHILMCTSLHLFFVACGYETMRLKGCKMQIAYLGGFIPYVTNGYSLE